MVSNTKKRVFIAVNFGNRAKEEMVRLQNKIENSFNDACPIKWTRKENLHITVFFIGYVYDDDLISILDQVENVVRDFKPFRMKFNEVDFMPREKHRKMVWVFGEKNETLENLRQKIKKVILSTEKETESFLPHITLGRIVQWQFKKIEEEEIPNINDNLVDFETNVESIEIMESEIKKGGTEYIILKRIIL
ncbi:MAG: RNA 2',3'-cyclic phosphodiesterase [Candidatus Pacebacteria bacterium]|nr:RNA 2',3'-cyclic phosphodiesterase [Candidatus Paceibacterota bacterium]MDD4333576.1 RNA 2',3'-cyclic phosphodiesterase [Candidatus Paceibacterota bacterium]